MQNDTILSIQTLDNIYEIVTTKISSKPEDRERFLSKLFSKIISDGYFMFSTDKKTVCINKENIIAISIETQTEE